MSPGCDVIQLQFSDWQKNRSNEALSTLIMVQKGRNKIEPIRTMIYKEMNVFIESSYKDFERDHIDAVL